MISTKKLMNKCYLDANILIYFKNEESPFFPQAKKIITTLVEKDFSLFVSPLTLDEFLHGLKLQLALKKVNPGVTFTLLSRSMKEIMELPSLTIINPPVSPQEQLQVVSFMQKFGLKPRDAYHLLTIQTHAITYFATLDNDFLKIFQKKIVLPILY